MMMMMMMMKMSIVKVTGRQILQENDAFFAHDMPYDPIQGQGQGDKTFNVNSSIFKAYLCRYLKCELLTNDYYLN